MKDKVKNCKTFLEVIEVINQEYDLNQPMKPLAKGAVIVGVDKLIKMLNPPKR